MPPKKKAKAKTSRGVKRRWQQQAALLAQLEGLPEAEKRQRLLDLLQADLSSEERHVGRRDATWSMPTVDAEGRTTSAGPELSFDCRTSEVTLHEDALTALRKACRLLFALDGSSWLPCNATPRCLPERLAAAVFRQHTQGAAFDPMRSGAEWWGQVRQQGHVDEGIQFHWDLDEDAVEHNQVNVTPHLSTVTYLTDHGAPTLVVDQRCPRDLETRVQLAPLHWGVICSPRIGKHLVFDGQLLHGTVPAVDNMLSADVAGGTAERITFLVNIWLNHRPSHCHLVPEELVGRLGDSSLPFTLAPAVALPRMTLGAGQRRNFEATFGRRKPHTHLLKVPLPNLESLDCATSVTLDWDEDDCAEIVELSTQGS